MPYSSSVFDSIVKKIISFLNPKRCLDVGAGAGKYGLMIKAMQKNPFLLGVEIEPDYIKKFKLKEIYKKVLRCNAADLIDKIQEDKFDLVILGDVLEHMKKSAGIDLLNFLVYRSKFILVVYPEKYIQNIVGGYKNEAHISIWNEKDFEIFDHTKLKGKGKQRLLIIRGYVESSKKISQIEKIIKTHL